MKGNPKKNYRERVDHSMKNMLNKKLSLNSWRALIDEKDFEDFQKFDDFNMNQYNLNPIQFNSAINMSLKKSTYYRQKKDSQNFSSSVY